MLTLNVTSSSSVSSPHHGVTVHSTSTSGSALPSIYVCRGATEPPKSACISKVAYSLERAAVMSPPPPKKRRLEKEKEKEKIQRRLAVVPSDALKSTSTSYSIPRCTTTPAPCEAVAMHCIIGSLHVQQSIKYNAGGFCWVDNGNWTNLKIKQAISNINNNTAN